MKQILIKHLNLSTGLLTTIDLGYVSSNISSLAEFLWKLWLYQSLNLMEICNINVIQY